MIRGLNIIEGFEYMNNDIQMLTVVSEVQSILLFTV